MGNSAVGVPYPQLSGYYCTRCRVLGVVEPYTKSDQFGISYIQRVYPLALPHSARYLNPAKYNTIHTALSAEYEAHLPLLRTLRNKVVELVRYEPTIGARVLHV